MVPCWYQKAELGASNAQAPSMWPHQSSTSPVATETSATKLSSVGNDNSRVSVEAR